MHAIPTEYMYVHQWSNYNTLWPKNKYTASSTMSLLFTLKQSLYKRVRSLETCVCVLTVLARFDTCARYILPQKVAHIWTYIQIFEFHLI